LAIIVRAPQTFPVAVKSIKLGPDRSDLSTLTSMPLRTVLKFDS
jgi:hypothetical protein